MVEHSTLTGASLHEPKGVDTADADRVYVSNGAGGGTWTTVSADMVEDDAKAFQTRLLHVVDQKSAGTDAGTFTQGAWQTRTLNTTRTNEISGASLASNQITLPSGTYFIMASASAKTVRGHQTRLRNITDGTTTLVGTAEDTDTTVHCASKSYVNGRFTIASAKSFELQHRCESTRLTDGFGYGPTGFGEVGIFAEVMIWKVA